MRRPELIRAKRGRVLRLIFYAAILQIAIWPQVLHAATSADIETPAATITGSTQALLGSEIQIYSIELDAGTNNPFSNNVWIGKYNAVALGGSPLALDIYLGEFTGSVFDATDISELKLYRSTDAVFDLGDTYITNTTVINEDLAPFDSGVDVTSFDMSTADPSLDASRKLPYEDLVPSSVWFIATAVISPTATEGHTFRVGVAANHLGVYDTPPLGTGENNAIGGAVVQMQGNHIVIAADTPLLASGVRSGGGGGIGIPFGGEPVMMVLLLCTGLYMIYRTSG
ncbi:MAG: hypothetical protein HN780_05895 [Gemmatimonadetes bacterium]|nr:hypothetical protein [Gemmatimonadota bacterium]